MRHIRFAIFQELSGQWTLERKWRANNLPHAELVGRYDTWDEAVGVYLWHQESYNEDQEFSQ